MIFLLIKIIIVIIQLQQQLIENSLEIDQSAYQQILGMKTKGKNNICQTTFENGQLGYQCFDCSSQENHIICQDCLQIEKHKGHLIMYKYCSGGYCDCGDQLTMKKESFCDKHQSNANNIQIIQLDEIICDQYRQLIQITFALLINKTEQLTGQASEQNEFLHAGSSAYLLYLFSHVKQFLLKYLQIHSQIHLLGHNIKHNNINHHIEKIQNYSNFVLK